MATAVKRKPNAKRGIGAKPDKVKKAALEIGQRIRELRENAGLSQRDIAMPGVSYAYISRIERGTRMPSAKALIKISSRLNTTPLYLMTGDYLNDCPYCGREVFR